MLSTVELWNCRSAYPFFGHTSVSEQHHEFSNTKPSPQVQFSAVVSEQSTRHKIQQHFDNAASSSFDALVTEWGVAPLVNVSCHIWGG
jgi:hypothetical protein